MMIQLTENEAELYKNYLDSYCSKFHKHADASIRTQAFICVKNGSFPSWHFK